MLLNLGLNLTVNLGIIKPKGGFDDAEYYSEVLRACDDGATVYLTKNGRGKYVVQSLTEYERLQATVKLLAELGKGMESVRREGGLSIDEAFAGLED